MGFNLPKNLRSHSLYPCVARAAGGKCWEVGIQGGTNYAFEQGGGGGGGSLVVDFGQKRGKKNEAS